MQAKKQSTNLLGAFINGLVDIMPEKRKEIIVLMSAIIVEAQHKIINLEKNK